MPPSSITASHRFTVAENAFTWARESKVPGRFTTDLRELVITGAAYIAVYTMNTNTVQIRRVLHGAQRWPEELPKG